MYHWYRGTILLSALLTFVTCNNKPTSTKRPFSKHRSYENFTFMTWIQDHPHPCHIEKIQTSHSNILDLSVFWSYPISSSSVILFSSLGGFPKNMFLLSKNNYKTKSTSQIFQMPPTLMILARKLKMLPKVNKMVELAISFPGLVCTIVLTN